MESSSLDLLNSEKVHATAGLAWELAVSSEQNTIYAGLIAISACLRTRLGVSYQPTPGAHIC